MSPKERRHLKYGSKAIKRRSVGHTQPSRNIDENGLRQQHLINAFDGVSAATSCTRLDKLDRAGLSLQVSKGDLIRAEFQMPLIAGALSAVRLNGAE